MRPRIGVGLWADERCHEVVTTKGGCGDSAWDGLRMILPGQRDFGGILKQAKTRQARLGVNWSLVQILSARHCQPDTCQPDTHKQDLNCCDRLAHPSQNTSLGPIWDHSLAEPELASVRKRTAKPFTRVAGLASRAGVYAVKRLFRPECSGRRAVATYPAPTGAPRLIGPRWAGQPRISTG